jgi:hypothetical protein
VQRLAGAARASGTPLRAAAEADAEVRRVLSLDAVARALDPAGALGATGTFIDQALARWRAAERPRE